MDIKCRDGRRCFRRQDIDRLLGELVGELEDKGYLIDWKEASKERDANA